MVWFFFKAYDCIIFDHLTIVVHCLSLRQLLALMCLIVRWWFCLFRIFSSMWRQVKPWPLLEMIAESDWVSLRRKSWMRGRSLSLWSNMSLWVCSKRGDQKVSCDSTKAIRRSSSVQRWLCMRTAIKPDFSPQRVETSFSSKSRNWRQGLPRGRSSDPWWLPGLVCGEEPF